MALRLLDIFVPPTSAERVLEVVRAPDVPAPPGMRQSTTSSGMVRTSLLVAAEDAEAMMDLMHRHFSTQDGFQMIVVTVEASVPRPEQPEPVSGKAPPGAPRISRQELYMDIAQTMTPSPIYFGMVVLSTIVAAVGLPRSEIAVIIGAMVIAPLLGPNIAHALATTLGDGELARRAIRVNAAGVLSALSIAVLIGVALPVSPSAPEIASRTRVGLEDIALALAAGGAGALSFTTGISSALVGVMVSVALLRPWSRPVSSSAQASGSLHPAPGCSC